MKQNFDGGTGPSPKIQITQIILTIKLRKNMNIIVLIKHQVKLCIQIQGTVGLILVHSILMHQVVTG